jgi:3-methyladenine DNA glycosylase Tag
LNIEGFANFIWNIGLKLSTKERIITGLYPKTHMRRDFTTKTVQRLYADGVHPTKSITFAVKALRKKGFKFIGETIVLNFFQVFVLDYIPTPNSFLLHFITFLGLWYSKPS